MSDISDRVTKALPDRISFEQIAQALAIIAPGLEPRDVRHIVVSPSSVDIATFHPAEPRDRVHTYRLDHVQGAATEGSDR